MIEHTDKLVSSTHTDLILNRYVPSHWAVCDDTMNIGISMLVYFMLQLIKFTPFHALSIGNIGAYCISFWF